MAFNLTIESPNFDKIDKEAGQFTSEAVSTLWFALNDTRDTERRDSRAAKERLEPKILEISASGSQDNIDTMGASLILFTGASAANLTGFRAPETGKNRILLVLVTGAGTITLNVNVTSETANQIQTTTNADVAVTQNHGTILAYYSGKWRQII